MSRTGVEFRDGRFADVQSVYKALTGIEKDFLTPGRTVYKDSPVLSRTVAYDGDRPVGFADWYPSRKKSRAHLCVAVSNGARGKGLAGKMAIDSLKKLVRQLAEDKARARREGGAELDKWRSQARIRRFVWGLDAKNNASARAAEKAGFREQEFKRPHKFRRFVMSRGEAERMLPKYIGFPEEEHKTLIGRDFIVTHRVSNDARRFRKGDKVRTPWGAEYVVADRSDLKKADNSPYYGELTDAQRRLLRAYRRISLLRLEKKAEADIPAIYDEVRKAYAGMGYPVSGDRLVVSTQPTYTNGKPVPADVIAPEVSGGNTQDDGTVRINPDYRSVMRHWGLKGSGRDFLRTIIGHELGHHIDKTVLRTRARSAERRRLLREIRKSKFHTVYTDSYGPGTDRRKLDKELLAEYLANLVNGRTYGGGKS